MTRVIKKEVIDMAETIDTMNEVLYKQQETIEEMRQMMANKSNDGYPVRRMTDNKNFSIASDVLIENNTIIEADKEEDSTR